MWYAAVSSNFPLWQYQVSWYSERSIHPNPTTMSKQKLRGVALAIKRAGSQVLFAEALGVSQQAVSLWLRQGYVPVLRVVEIEQLTKVPRGQLVNPRLHELVR